MIEHALSRIGGVGLYGVISICIFGAVFVAVLWWLLSLKKDYLKEMRELPLRDDDAPEAESNLKPDRSHE